ncbi:chloride channel protein [Niabella ginsengisoli]|uniref:chloride channel protein n=1 Tax=Niabella ginsengisoli TaxID=522298 RepID=UPI0021D4110D|nr:chloride channel protein [Niabella ginsengisoli]
MSTHQSLSFKHTFTGLSNLFKKYPGFSFIVKWLLICSILGGLIGSASAAFLTSLNWVTSFREQHKWIIWLLPAAGFLIGWVYHHYGKSVESGNNLILKSIHQPANKIPLKMAVFVYAGTILTHLFGGSAGREGTAIQMAGSIADQLSKPFRLTNEERRILLIASVARFWICIRHTFSRCCIWIRSFFNWSDTLQCYSTCLCSFHLC